MIVINTVDGSGMGKGLLIENIGEISVTFCGATGSDLVAPLLMTTELKRRMSDVFMANDSKAGGVLALHFTHRDKFLPMSDFLKK